MDKFQKRILYNGNTNQKDTVPYCFSCEEEKSGCSWPIKFNPNEDEFIIFQSDDIFSTVYYLNIKHTAIQAVSVNVNESWIDAKKEGDTFSIALDFDNKATKIKIIFKYGIAEDYIFDTVYKDASRERYYKRQEENKKKEKAAYQESLDNAVDIETRTSNMLVNIHFNPCSPDCERTVIELYMRNRRMANYEAEKGVFFKSISGLAEGYYTFVLKQYNSKKELIYESKSHSFFVHKQGDGIAGDAF